MEFQQERVQGRSLSWMARGKALQHPWQSNAGRLGTQHLCLSFYQTWQPQLRVKGRARSRSHLLRQPALAALRPQTPADESLQLPHHPWHQQRWQLIK